MKLQQTRQNLLKCQGHCLVKLSFQWMIVIYGVSEDHLNKVSLVH